MTNYDEILTKLDNIQVANNKQGENLSTAVKAIEEAGYQIQEIIDYIRASDIHSPERTAILTRLYATYKTLSKSTEQMKFNY